MNSTSSFVSSRRLFATGCALAAALLSLSPAAARGEAMLQFFNAKWTEIAEKAPELAEAGYTSIWLPPPAKANGGYSVGYDLFDPFDLGSTNLRDTWSTRYGTEAELHNLVDTLHRFGIRVYFDNIMNHRAYDIPGFNESTPIDVYPGMVAEDFHLRRTSDGFYRKWDNCRDWNDGWQVMNLGLSDLIDIAHETPNCNHGTYEGATQAKPSIVRHPNNPEFYDRMPNVNVDPSLWNPWDWTDNTNANIYVGFGPDNGITTNMIAQYPDFFKEDVGAYLCRSVRWMMHTTKADGFRLDAVKHVPDYFFGQQDGDKDGSNAGYCGNIQWQFNMTHGYSDWDNHRDTVFDTDAPRDDAMVFGEHLGSPPGLDGYIAAGMRLVDNPLRNQLVQAISSYNLWDFEKAGWGGLAPGCGVMHSQSHDNVPQSMDRRPLEQCFYMMREGLGLFYTDGNNHAATLSGSGGAFPRWAESAYLGQWGDTRMPNLCQLNGDFGRGWQRGVYSKGDFAAWERIDGRHGGGDNASQVTCLVLANAGWDYGQPLPSLDQVSFPHQGNGPYGADAYLYQYADVPYVDWNPHFYTYASGLWKVNVPANAYFIFGYKNPDPSSIWPGNVIDVLEDGVVAETTPLVRTDGADGDAGYNPYSLPDDDSTDYSYTINVPRVTKGTNVQFRVSVDGSAGDVLLRLDGGMDLNGVHHDNDPDADLRDNPPALSDDVYLGFEGINFNQRIWPEKFAAADSDHCALGSGDATTFLSESSGATNWESTAVNDYSSGLGQVSYVWHRPDADTDPFFPSVVTNTAGSTNTYTLKASVNGRDGTADGFGNWQDRCNGNAGSFAGTEASGCGITGFSGNKAFGLYANNDDSANAIIVRPLSHGADLSSASVDVGMLWDSNIAGKFKGIEFMDGSGDPVFGVQMGNSPTVTYYGAGNLSGTWSTAYGSSAFNITLTRTANGYTVSGTTRDGGTFAGATVTTAATIASFKAYMNATDDNANRQLYFDNLSYTAVSTGSSVVTNIVPGKQLVRSGNAVTVYAKTKKADGMSAALYYTTDGTSWPNGAGQVAANATTLVTNGTWFGDGADGESDWWQFTVPLPSASTTLRYKIGVFHRQGTLGTGDWRIVWPGSPGDIAQKLPMLGQWSTSSQDLTTKEYYKHNDYANDQKGHGLPDGLHLLTARAFLNRTDGTPVYKTYRQTFMIDCETPRGELLYPDAGTSEIGGSEYGFILRTDPTVTAVYYHITDSNDDNNTVGNGMVSNAVVWGQATVAGPWTKEMTQNTTYPKLWRFTYPRIPSSGNATVRIRLVETSSASTNEWSATDPAEDSASALHFTEITKTLATRGAPENFYFGWPTADGDYVEEGWNLRLVFSKSLVDGIDAFDAFKVYIQSEENASTNRGTLFTTNDIALSFNWDVGNDNAELTIPMPNVYNGIQGWLYGVRVELVNTNAGHNYFKNAVRFVTHHGARKPTVAITTPPEVDSDGAAYVIEMPDVPASVLAAETNAWMRQTPIVVQTDLAVTNVDISFISAPEGASTNIAFKSCNTNTGSLASWSYVWTVSAPGAYRFTATGWANTNGTTLTVASNTAVRNATIQFKEMASNTDTNNLDWDDDGILNSYENTKVSLPTNRVEESWTQDEVFIHFASGRSSDTSPDTDSDGLPDALELGYRACQDYSATDASADSNADGWPNAIRDLDPPFYNTKDNSGKVPKAEDVSTTAPRTTLRAGSVTDPSNPDSDYDGIPDGLEDANRNGWTDGDGSPFDPDWTPGEEPWNPWLEFNWPDREIGSGEHWEETSPCIADSDSDGLSDGYGEDLNFNGYTDLGVRESATGALRRLAPADYAAYGIGIDNASTRYSSSTLATKPYTSRALDYSAIRSNLVSTTAYPRVVFYETDPLESDTDGDGLPDGWEVQNGLDPLDDGVYSYRDGGPGNPRNGAAGDPDGDGILNAEEYGGGTDPNVANTAEHPEGEGAITIGRGAAIGAVNGVTNYNEYLDWSLDDLVALDDYDQGGNVSDIYRGFNDGWESSRDLVAFYFHDGGDRDAGGDGKLYFRVDLFDLQAYAEEGHLDVYVAINFGNYGSDKAMAELPNAVNCKSAMKWNAVVGVWDSANGLLYTTDGSTVRESASDFYGAYFNSQLDSIAWSINRQALVDAGWKTGDPDSLMFQVYTTRDFTNDDGGSGDKGGLNDFTDTIGDDWLCSDYGQDWNYVANHGTYSTCVSRNSGEHAWNNRGAHAKLALLAHGNQADERSAVIQNYVNNGEGAGYHRPVLIHNIYTNCPLNLHITPTLAMALQWAEADPSKNQAWRSGPALNAQIAEGVAKGNFRLLGSTYSDHILPYFSHDFNAADVALANDTLNAVYGGSVTSSVVSTNILWSSERVAGRNVFRQIRDLGYRATIIDQTPHLQDWVNREYALGDNGYKINAFWFPTTGSAWASIDAFVISSAAADYRYATSDSGLSTDLRKLFIRRARSGQALLSTLFYNWEDFASSGNADAYDLCLRWIANHPWIKVVTLEDALGSVDRADEDNKNALYHSDALRMQDWVNHACNEDYDNWYFGSLRSDGVRRHESLAGKKFELRAGATNETPLPYGTMTNGLLASAWAAVDAISNPSVKRLALETIAASVFETAFHNEDNNNLTRWSYGDYVWPSEEPNMGLQGFAWSAQGQTRMAAIYSNVDVWARTEIAKTQVITNLDLDLDGEPEPILRNNAVMAVFERQGGRMVGAWLKRPAADGAVDVVQMIGNFVSMPYSGWEDEGLDNGSARRAAGLTDWWDNTAKTNAVNILYNTKSNATYLTLTNTTTHVGKQIYLDSNTSTTFRVTYRFKNSGGFSVRSGISPDLDGLLVLGDTALAETTNNTTITLTTSNAAAARLATVTLNVVTGNLNTATTDYSDTNLPTINMRNLPQTRQVEVHTTGNRLDFTIDLSATSTEPEEDPGTPPEWSQLPNSAVTVGTLWSFSPSTCVTGAPAPTITVLSTATGWNFTDGLFTFTPAVPGTYTFTFTATNAAGSADATLTISATALDPYTQWMADKGYTNDVPARTNIAPGGQTYEWHYVTDISPADSNTTLEIVLTNDAFTIDPASTNRLYHLLWTTDLTKPYVTNTLGRSSPTTTHPFPTNTSWFGGIKVTIP